MSEDTVADENSTDESSESIEKIDSDETMLEEQEADQADPAPVNKLSDDSSPNIGKEMNLDMILELPVTISMEIGRTKISIRNLLQLSQGSVIELDRLAGEAMDVLVNDTLIAHGEVVVVNDKFGIRLTDVISADERIKKLR
jgi:flagellar motor switch protein FliN